MYLFTSTAFLFAIATIVAVGGECLCDSIRNNSPACCFAGNGCRKECARNGEVSVITGVFSYDCSSKYVLITGPGANLWALASAEYKVVPGDYARLFVLDVLVFIYILFEKVYYIPVVGNINEAGCPIPYELTYSDQKTITATPLSHKTIREAIAKQQGPYYAPCNSFRSVDPVDSGGFLAIDFGPSVSGRYCQDKKKNNEVYSALRETVAQNAFNERIDVYGNETDERNFCQYAVRKSPQANCGTPSSCTPLIYLAPFQKVIETAGCDARCINPNNDDSASAIARCYAQGSTILNPLYATVPARITLIFPGHCSDVNFAEFAGTLDVADFLLVFSKILELF